MSPCGKYHAACHTFGLRDGRGQTGTSDSSHIAMLELLRRFSDVISCDVCGSTLFGEKSFCLPMVPRYTKTLGKLSLRAICSFHGNLERWSCHSSNRNHLPKPSDCNELHEDYVIHNINMANTIDWREWKHCLRRKHRNCLRNFVCPLG